MRKSAQGLFLLLSVALAASAYAGSASGIVEEPPVQQGYGTGAYGGYGPIGPASSPNVVVPYLGPAGIVVYPLTQNQGSAKPSPDSTVTVNYRGWLENGKEFDSSYSRGKPSVFKLNQTIPCWQKGLSGVPAGNRVKLVCPPSTAYGSQQTGNIPPDSTLIFEIDLLEVSD